MSRTSVDVDSLIHANPIPGASRIGPLLVSSIIPPYDPGERRVPEGLDAQIANLFVHVANLLDAAGADWEAVAKMTFYVKDPAVSRPALNGVWVERFPDADARPARHNLRVVDDGGPVQVSCDFIAYIRDVESPGRADPATT